MEKWTRVNVLLAEGGRVRIAVPLLGMGPLPEDVRTSSSTVDGLPRITLQQGGAVVETFFDQVSGSLEQICSEGAPTELILRGRRALLRLTSMLVQTADGAVEAGTEYLFLCLASGLPLLPLDLALRGLSRHIGQIVRPVGIVALFIADDPAAQDPGGVPVLAYVTEGRIPPGFGGYLEAARIGAITGHEFRWEPRYAGKQDRFPGARTVWTPRS